jgi:heat-inducible transcriptional repressor
MAPSTSGRGSTTPRPPLSERNRRILAWLVREFIERGEPVSSLWLAEHSRLGVSSATVRNALAALEELGYVTQPHTSAGRVPTDLAYRCYVDQLLEGRRPARPALGVAARLRQATTLEDVLESVSQELSRSSHHLGFALAPASQNTVLKRIDFVALDPDRVLVVLVGQSGQVSHKVVGVSHPLSPEELTQAANYVNHEFGGRSLGEVRDLLAARMQQDRALYDRLLARVLELTASSLAEANTQGQLYVHGTSSLVDDSGQVDEAGVSMARLRALLAMIEEKHRLIQLLSAYLEEPSLTVVIGAEHLSPELKGYSLVASASAGPDGTAVGVIGPTRMRYMRAITAVDSVAQTLVRVLANTS